MDDRESDQLVTKHPADGQEVEYCVRDWDDFSELPIPHFNFIIQLLLPRHLVSKIPEREQKAVQHINERQIATYGENPSIKCVAVGSAAECYMLPPMMHKVPGLEAKLYSDMDILFEWQIPPLKDNCPKICDDVKMIFEWNITHQGYARVRVNERSKMFQKGDPSYFSKFGDGYYLSAKKQRDERFEDLQSAALSEKSEYTLDAKGPAIAIEDSTIWTSEFLASVDRLQIRQEMVTAIPCIWPLNAMDWKERMIKSKWLTPSFVDSAITNGCHLVPVAHRHSPNPDIEWRISFATTEVKIASAVVTPEQRQCYIYLKLLRQIVMKDKNLISSYHCKSVFLYSCERLPSKSWEDNPGLCVLYMLDTLLKFVRCRHLPSFFIPENNLIDHFSKEEFEDCENILLVVRSSPLERILEYTDTHVIGEQSVISSFRQLISVVISDIQTFSETRNVEASIDAFIKALLNVVYSNLAENKITHAVSYTMDLCRFFMKYFPSDDMEYYIFCVFAECSLMTQLVQVFENVLSYAHEYPKLIKLQGHLAVLYYCTTFNFKPDSRQYSEFIEKSKVTFEAFLARNDTKSSVEVDYANFLLGTGNAPKAEEYLHMFLSSEIDVTLLQNKFSKITYLTLETRIRAEIQNLFEKSVLVSIPSRPLAYYLYVKCLLIRGDKTKAEQTIEDFENESKRSSSYWCFFLLGLSMLELEFYHRAEIVFLAAMKIHSKVQFNLNTKVHVCHVQRLISCGKVQDAVQYITETANRFYKQVPVVDYITYIALNLTNIRHTVELFEQMSNMADEYPEMTQSRGNMASVYHAYAYEFDNDSEEYMTAMMQADTLFHTYIADGNERLSTKVEYALFMTSQDRWDDVIELLGNPMKIDFACEDRNSYGNLEINCLDAYLQDEVKVHGTLEAKAPVFAFYIYVKSALQIRQSNEPTINHVIERFNSYCENEKHARSYSLLGYTYMLTGRYTEAAMSFCKAVMNCNTYAVAKQNIQHCRLKAKETGQPQPDIRSITGNMLSFIPEFEGNFDSDFNSSSK